MHRFPLRSQKIFLAHPTPLGAFGASILAPVALDLGAFGASILALSALASAPSAHRPFPCAVTIYPYFIPWFLRISS